MRARHPTAHSLPTLFTLLAALKTQSGCSYASWEAEAASGCAGYASGTCEALARCGTMGSYASYEDCSAQLSDGCTFSLGLPDVYGSGAGAAQCGEMMRALDCDALTNNELPLGCQAPRGKRSDGASCRSSAQCAGGRCTDWNGAWGKCRELASSGDTCFAAGDCSAGLVCAPAGVCAALAEAAESCSDARPCRAPLACVAGSCAVVDAATTCQAYADMLCTQLNKCSPSVVTAVYGDPRTCSVRNAAQCASGVNPTGSRSVGAGVAACTRALDAISCHELLDHALPPACQVYPGPRMAGAVCGTDGECASAHCSKGLGASCGACVLVAADGQVCQTDADCLNGLICAGGTCRAPGGAGSACDAALRCGTPFVCAAGRCADPIGPGAACSTAADSCDRNQGLWCGPRGVCEPWLVAGPGAACNQTSNGWAVCVGGSSCVAGSEGATCAGPLLDGSPCAADRPPFCLAPAQCLAGVCSLGGSGGCQ